MTHPIEAYPLQWPVGWPREPKPQRSRFDTTFAKARGNVLYELRLLGARDVVISSNIPLRRDGLPYSQRREPDDPAIAVYFVLDGENRCIPVDRWDRAQDNLHAVGLTVGALRGVDRWGAKQMVSAAFAGFAALPAGGTASEAWWEVLGVAADASDAEIESAYRSMAKVHHPDRGGDVEIFRAVAEAYRAAKGRVTG